MYWLSSDWLLDGDSKDESGDCGRSDCASLAMICDCDGDEALVK